MKVSNFFKKPGSSIPRVYKGIKRVKSVSWAAAGMEFAMGVISARQKDVLNTSFSGFLSCWFLKTGKELYDMQKSIEPQFNQIVERAKRIKLNNKLGK